MIVDRAKFKMPNFARIIIPVCSLFADRKVRPETKLNFLKLALLKKRNILTEINALQS
jgi:hypothetical protein